MRGSHLVATTNKCRTEYNSPISDGVLCDRHVLLTNATHQRVKTTFGTGPWYEISIGRGCPGNSTSCKVTTLYQYSNALEPAY